MISEKKLTNSQNDQPNDRQTSTEDRSGENSSSLTALAGLYSQGKRFQEIISIALCTFLILINSFFLSYHFELRKWISILIAAVSGIFTADFLCGLVHWSADTWGSTELPILGPTIIRSFREHHLDSSKILRHDFVETNGDNFMSTIPAHLYLVACFTLGAKSYISQNYSWFCYIFLLAIFIALTNQIHKWSHTYFGLPEAVLLLQQIHLILPRNTHRYHHIQPHNTHYCITTGWLNYPLDKIRFWYLLEKGITHLTGIKPRKDDFEWIKGQKILH
ncbi:plasmanylethanolamine desaturase Kua [Brevipalpus obovatus]|uniref:plasmanylethanolamine desaturase Kua n=1 Tax=Brevipalpus obovatus TaxID=246614 RepID=UPI003D9E21EC